jgi:hypothetical protein
MPATGIQLPRAPQLLDAFVEPPHHGQVDAVGASAFYVIRLELETPSEFLLRGLPFPSIAVEHTCQRRVSFRERVIERERLLCRRLRLRHGQRRSGEALQIEEPVGVGQA